jgi:hypothetical protein
MLLLLRRRGRREFLEARVFAERIKHWIEPEQCRRQRHTYTASPVGPAEFGSYDCDLSAEPRHRLNGSVQPQCIRHAGERYWKKYGRLRSKARRIHCYMLARRKLVAH